MSGPCRLLDSGLSPVPAGGISWSGTSSILAVGDGCVPEDDGCVPGNDEDAKSKGGIVNVKELGDEDEPNVGIGNAGLFCDGNVGVCGDPMSASGIEG